MGGSGLLILSGGEAVAEESSAVVNREVLGWEGEAFEEVCEDVGGGVGAPIPAEGKGAPWSGCVSDVEEAKEVLRMSPPQSATGSA